MLLLADCVSLCSVVGDLMKNVNHRAHSTAELERYLKRPLAGRVQARLPGALSPHITSEAFRAALLNRCAQHRTRWNYAVLAGEWVHVLAGIGGLAGWLG